MKISRYFTEDGRTYYPIANFVRTLIASLPPQGLALYRATFDPEHTVAMICGPEIMMRFCARKLEDEGVDAADIYVSMERSMACGVGFCGHCQFGPDFVCKDGPVFPYERVAPLINREA